MTQFRHILDVEIEKLERRRARYQERSPSPIAASSSNIMHVRTPYPSLSLPSISPMSAQLPYSKQKIDFLSEIGLAQVSSQKKKGIYINLILLSQILYI